MNIIEGVKKVLNERNQGLRTDKIVITKSDIPNKVEVREWNGGYYAIKGYYTEQEVSSMYPDIDLESATVKDVEI